MIPGRCLMNRDEMTLAQKREEAQFVSLWRHVCLGLPALAFIVKFDTLSVSLAKIQNVKKSY